MPWRIQLYTLSGRVGNEGVAGGNDVVSGCCHCVYAVALVVPGSPCAVAVVDDIGKVDAEAEVVDIVPGEAV